MNEFNKVSRTGSLKHKITNILTRGARISALSCLNARTPNNISATIKIMMLKSIAALPPFYLKYIIPPNPYRRTYSAVRNIA